MKMKNQARKKEAILCVNTANTCALLRNSHLLRKGLKYVRHR